MMNSTPLSINFRTLVDAVHLEMHANGFGPVEALRTVIERNDLSDEEGIHLFSAIMSRARDRSVALRLVAA
jgi:hypothetical protein